MIIHWLKSNPAPQYETGTVNAQVISLLDITVPPPPPCHSQALIPPAFSFLLLGRFAVSEQTIRRNFPLFASAVAHSSAWR